MRIGLDDLEPEIGAKVAERLTAPLKEFLREDIHWGGGMPFHFNPTEFTLKRRRAPSEVERRAYELRKKRKNFGRRSALWLTGGLLGGPAVGFGLANLVYVMSHSDFAAWAAWTSVWTAGTAVGIVQAIRSSRVSMRGGLALEEMQAVFPLLSLTRVERIYCDTILLLARTEISPDTERAVRDTVHELNGLLQNSRQLEQRRKALLPVLGTNPISQLEAEYGELGRKFDTATDSMVKQSLKQSLEMCASRLENARAFEAGLERLKAQEEAIVQTISSAQAALARMQLVSQPQAEFAAQEIAEKVTQMNRQTYAVEQAVEEVLLLRG